VLAAARARVWVWVREARSGAGGGVHPKNPVQGESNILLSRDLKPGQQRLVELSTSVVRHLPFANAL